MSFRNASVRVVRLSQRMSLSTFETPVGRKVDEYLYGINTKKALKPLIYRAKNATSLLARELITSEGEPIVPRSPYQVPSEDDVIQWVRQAEFEDLSRIQSKLPLFNKAKRSKLTPNVLSEFLIRSAELGKLSEGLTAVYDLPEYRFGPRLLSSVYVLQYVKLLKQGNATSYKELKLKLAKIASHSKSRDQPEDGALCVLACKLRFLGNREFKAKDEVHSLVHQALDVLQSVEVPEIAATVSEKQIKHAIKVNQLKHAVYTIFVEALEAAPQHGHDAEKLLAPLKQFTAAVEALADKVGEQLVINRLKQNFPESTPDPKTEPEEVE